MVSVKTAVLVLACFVFIDGQVIRGRCPKKCGKVRKVKINNIIDCGCQALDSTYGIIAEVPKCECSKVYLDSTNVCGCQYANIDSQLYGLLDYIAAAVETKGVCQNCGIKSCGCEVPICQNCGIKNCACGIPVCQNCGIKTCGCEIPVYQNCGIKSCGCEVPICHNCGIKNCGCDIPILKCGCQTQAVRIPNSYDLLSAIELPSCGCRPVVQLANYEPLVDTCNCGKCGTVSCRNLPYEVLATVADACGCRSSLLELPAYVYDVQTPVIEVKPIECGCGLRNCACGLAKVEPCACGLAKVGPCNCALAKIEPCSCGVVNCGCAAKCGCGIANCGCVSPCGCGLSPCVCGSTNCGCTGSCGCGISSCGYTDPCGCGKSGCGCGQYLRKVKIPPPFL